MECAVAIDETFRNLLMLATWLPSLAAAACVYMLLMRRRRDTSDLRGSLFALFGAFVTLFGTWGLLLTLGGRLLC